MPFEAPDGTVWCYRFIVSAHKTVETLFLVLPGRRHLNVGARSETEFRQYLDLMTGDFEWFAKGSAMNDRAERLA